MSTTHLELSMVAIWHHNVNHSTRILFEGERFEPEEVFLFWDINVDQSVADPIRLEDIWVRRLADLALELLPHVRDLVRLLFDLHLLLQPVFEAIIMDIAHGTITFTGVQQRISAGLLSTPANLTLNLAVVAIYHSAVDLNILLSIELILTLISIIVVLSFALNLLLRRAVSLFDWRGTSINDTSSLEITVGRLSVRSEVFDAEF